MPGVAREWAFSEDKRTIYFKIHEDATYDDGVGIRALDYLISVYIRVSNNVTAPYFKQYLREQFAQWTVYGDHTLAVTTRNPSRPWRPCRTCRGSSLPHRTSTMNMVRTTKSVTSGESRPPPVPTS